MKSIWTCVQTKCIISSPNKGWQRKIRFKIETNLVSHGSIVCAEVLPLCSLSMRFLEVIMCHPNTCQSKWILLPTNFIIDKGRKYLKLSMSKKLKAGFLNVRSWSWFDLMLQSMWCRCINVFCLKFHWLNYVNNGAWNTTVYKFDMAKFLCWYFFYDKWFEIPRLLILSILLIMEIT